MGRVADVSGQWLVRGAADWCRSRLSAGIALPASSAARSQLGLTAVTALRRFDSCAAGTKPMTRTWTEALPTPPALRLPVGLCSVTVTVGLFRVNSKVSLASHGGTRGRASHRRWCRDSPSPRTAGRASGSLRSACREVLVAFILASTWPSS